MTVVAKISLATMAKQKTKQQAVMIVIVVTPKIFLNMMIMRIIKLMTLSILFNGDYYVADCHHLTSIFIFIIMDHFCKALVFIRNKLTALDTFTHHLVMMMMMMMIVIIILNFAFK